MIAPKPIEHHPNAALAGTSGAVSIVLVWVLSLWAINMEPVVASAITTLFATMALIIGRKGLLGIWHTIMRGEQ